MAKKSSSQVKEHAEKEKLNELLAFDGETVYGAKWKKRFVHCEGSQQLRLFEIENTGIIGVDEVGRGCLAGPVVASAVMLKDLNPDSLFNRSISTLDDSKKLTESDRETLASLISDGAYCAIAECSNEKIDEINILQASLLAMQKAVTKLVKQIQIDSQKPVLLIDGNKRIKTNKYKQITVIKGDSKSASIAAASVVAKVYRDNLMKKLARKHPHYCWESNKGYPSKVHKQAIADHGLTKWHRKTFRWQLKPED